MPKPANNWKGSFPAERRDALRTETELATFTLTCGQSSICVATNKVLVCCWRRRVECKVANWTMYCVV